MALLYKADIHPSKLELVRAWAPTRSWFPSSDASALTQVAAFRFDDPDGEVGVETVLLRVADDGPVVQVPLTYRGAPLDGAEAHLITTMTHSVLGDRWVYDGAADPVYIATAATTAFGGGTQAELLVSTAGSDALERREPTAVVRGSGSAASEVPTPSVSKVETRDDGALTLVEAADVRLAIARVIADGALDAFAHAETIAGSWAGQGAAVPLVAAWRVE
jgi:hypothetical protein